MQPNGLYHIGQIIIEMNGIDFQQKDFKQIGLFNL